MIPGLTQTSSLTLRWLFNRLEQVYPERTIAAACDGKVVRRRTYREMAARARRLSGALDDAGVRTGERVLVYCRNSDDHLELMVGVPCAGRVYHALNPRLSERERRFIINHAADAIAFVDADLLDDWNALGVLPSVRKVVVITPPESPGASGPAGEDYETFLSTGDPEAIWPDLPETAAASLCYTSGTTGNPKGVLYSHRALALVSLAWMTADAMRISQADVYMPAVPLFHAHAWALPFCALLAGAPIVMPGSNVGAAALASLIEAEGVTLANGVPTIWSDLLDALRDHTVSGDQLRSMDRIVCGGSPVSESMLAAFDALKVQLIQVWGMTEMSPLGTVSRVRKEIAPRDHLRVRSMQGQPSPFVQLRLIGEDGADQAWDGRSVGELQVHGPWIAESYFDPASPDLRNDFDGFVTDPTGQKWLRTGDMAVITPDAYVRLLDRKKDLIKSGGEWISTIDLQQLIDSVEGVCASAVIGVPHPRWEERPVAYVEMTPGHVMDPVALRSALTDRIASWQAPDAFFQVAAMPRTSLGKIDKSALRQLYDRSHPDRTTTPEEDAR